MEHKIQTETQVVRAKCVTLFDRADDNFKGPPPPPPRGIYLKHPVISQEKHVYTLFELLNEDIAPSLNLKVGVHTAAF